MRDSKLESAGGWKRIERYLVQKKRLYIPYVPQIGEQHLTFCFQFPLFPSLLLSSPSLPGFPDRASSLKSYVHNKQSLRRRHRKFPTATAIAAAAVSLSTLSTAPTGNDPPPPTRLLHLGRAPDSLNLPCHPALDFHSLKETMARTLFWVRARRCCATYAGVYRQNGDGSGFRGRGGSGRACCASAKVRQVGQVAFALAGHQPHLSCRGNENGKE